MGKIKFNLAGWKEKLLNGADINKPDEKGWTALDYAIRADSIEGVEFCINKGADVNREIEKHDYATPLHFAAKYSRKPEMIEILVKHGAKIDALDMCEYIKLNVSSSELSFRILDHMNGITSKILTLVSDINVRDENQNTVLYEFIKRNNFRITKALMEAGADVNVKNNRGKTPLSCAVKYKAKGKIIDLLLAYGAKVDTEDKMVQSAVEAFLERQKNKPSATQLWLLN